MIYLAHDGSINGDWVSWYAIRMASRSPQRALVLVHVLEGDTYPELIEPKIKVLEARCHACQVELTTKTCPLQDRSVFQTLTRFIPEGRETICVCGTRVQSKKKGYLAGTVSARLLRHHPFNVLALRVVQPGVLGNARKFLLPLAGHPRRLDSLLPFACLFPPDIKTIYLLRIMSLSALRLQHLSSEQKRLLLSRGRSYLDQAAAQMAHEFGFSPAFLDTRVIVSDDWPREILMHASDLKMEMILLGASERTLPARLLYYENALERMLDRTPCDMAIYRGF